MPGDGHDERKPGHAARRGAVAAERPAGAAGARAVAARYTGQITFRRVADLDRAHRFYAGALRLPMVLDQGRCRIYRVTGEAYLGVCSAEAAEIAADSAVVCLLTDDVDGCFERLDRLGIAAEQPPRHNPDFAIYHGFVRDPDGHLVELQAFTDPRWSAAVAKS